MIDSYDKLMENNVQDKLQRTKIDKPDSFIIDACITSIWSLLSWW